MSKVLLKAETHQGSFELQLTDKKALAFAKKLHKNNLRERNLYWYGEHPHRRKKTRLGGYRAGIKRIPCHGPEPFVKVEFIHIEDEAITRKNSKRS
jgi:hypothetical protein